jgi:hypothetical protein
MENEKLLNDLKDKISDVLSKRLYEFKMDHDQTREQYDQFILSLSKDDTRSSDINHTKFPDDIILLMLESQGIKISDIREIKSIDCEYIDNENEFGYRINVTFHKEVNIITLNIDIKED